MPLFGVARGGIGVLVVAALAVGGIARNLFAQTAPYGIDRRPQPRGTVLDTLLPSTVGPFRRAVRATHSCPGHRGAARAIRRRRVPSLHGELGLRRALGASRRQVVKSVLLRAVGVGLGGVLVGLWLGPAVWGIMTGVIADLPAWDAATVARYAALLIAAAVLGAIVPAWQAARSTPAVLLA
jgi:hypothetical protein